LNFFAQFTRRIISINLNIDEVEIISDLNKWSGNKHEKDY